MGGYEKKLERSRIMEKMRVEGVHWKIKYNRTNTHHWLVPSSPSPVTLWQSSSTLTIRSTHYYYWFHRRYHLPCWKEMFVCLFCFFAIISYGHRRKKSSVWNFWFKTHCFVGNTLCMIQIGVLCWHPLLRVLNLPAKRENFRWTIGWNSHSKAHSESTQYHKVPQNLAWSHN